MANATPQPNTAPYLTVGIASYNYARFLPRAFAAIRRQQFADFELLYCDDGSTDDSVAVIKALMQANPGMNIRLVQGENGGVMVNKNRILDAARGRYLMLCDADDWMDDACLETLAAAAQKTDADRVIAGFRNVCARDGAPEGDFSTTQVESLPEHPSRWNQFQHHGCLYKTTIYRENNIRFRPDRYPDDFDFVERFNAASQTAAYLPEVLYNFYHDGTSASSTVDEGSSWHYLNLFSGVCQTTAELLPRLNKADHWQLEMAVLRIFYANLRATAHPGEYRRMKAELQATLPDYLQNPLLYNLKNSPYRPAAAHAARALALLDRAGLLPAAEALLRATRRPKRGATP